MPITKNRISFDDNTFNRGLGDGQVVCCLMKWERESSSFVPLNQFLQDANDGVVDKAEMATFDMWLKKAKGV